MANMTIENIGGMVRNGGVSELMDHGTQVQAPEMPGAETGSIEGKSFGQLLNDQIEQVNDLQLQADRAAKELTAGRNKNIHETMLMMEKADMNFRLAMQVRNKIIDAYREVMRMQV